MRELSTKGDLLIKVNKPPRCHNPHKSLTPQQEPITRLLLSSDFSRQRPYFNSIAFFVYTAPNKKKIVGFHHDRRKISRKVTSARGSINSNAESEGASASSLDVSAVSKEINNGSEEGNVTRERLPRTSPDYSLSSDSLLSETSASCFCFVEVSFSPFVLMTTAKTCASLNPRCGTCSLACCCCCFLARHVAFLSSCL